MSTSYVGLDLSLTSTGMCLLEPGEHPRVTSFGTATTGSDLPARRRRLEILVDQVVGFVAGDRLEFFEEEAATYSVLVEAPTYATNSGSQHDRSGHWWLTVAALLDTGLRVREISPTVVKAFATGKGTANKFEMHDFAKDEFPGLRLRNDDEVDALYIATLAEYAEEPDSGRVKRNAKRNAAASKVPKR